MFAAKAARAVPVQGLRRLATALNIPTPSAVQPLCQSALMMEDLAHWPQARITTLKNGLRVATEHTNSTSVNIGVFVDAGSRWETPENHGVAHYAEHLFFKGTGKRSQRDIEVEVENMGGNLNAYTSREQQCFYNRVLNKNDVEWGMEVLADLLTNSSFTERAITAERSTILTEWKEVEVKTMEEVNLDNLHKTAFLDQPLGRSILGSVESISAMTREKIVDFIRNHHLGRNMVLAVAGNVDHDTVVKHAAKLFANVPAEAVTPQPRLKATFLPGHHVHRCDDLPEVHYCIAFPTSGWDDPDMPVLMWLQSFLGQIDPHRNVYEGFEYATNFAKQRYALENWGPINWFNTQYSDVGLFGVSGVAERFTLDSSVMYALSELSTLVSGWYEQHYNDSSWMDEGRHNAVHFVLSSLDSPTSVCEELGRQVLTYGRRIHPMEMCHRVMDVSPEDVHRLTQRFFRSPFVATAVGPTMLFPTTEQLSRSIGLCRT